MILMCKNTAVYDTDTNKISRIVALSSVNELIVSKAYEALDFLKEY